MKTKHVSRWGLVVQTVPSVWVAVATAIALLLLGAFVAIAPVAADDDGIQRGIDADSARYQALGEYYQAQTGAERPYTDVSLFYAERMRAQAQAVADGDSIQRAIESHTARYQAWAELYRAQAQALAEPSLEREIRSNSAGWVASGVSSAEARAVAERSLEREIRSNSAGWAASGVSSAEASATLPYTDVSLFYAERMRAQAHAAARSAQLPVCPAEDEIPELQSYRRWEGC
jgi:hypothetical protein